MRTNTHQSAGLRPFSQIICAYLLFISSFLSGSTRAQDRPTQYVYGPDVNGVNRPFAVDRYPTLYTGDFGDCLGGQSLFNVTKFDTAYYADNLTMVFHLDGASNIRNDSLMSTMALPPNPPFFLSLWC